MKDTKIGDTVCKAEAIQFIIIVIILIPPGFRLTPSAMAIQFVCSSHTRITYYMHYADSRSMASPKR